MGLPLLLLFSSCSLSIFPGYHPQPGYQGTAPDTWFGSDTGHFLFNTSIDLMKNHFTGIMVIKPQSPGSYRVIFITAVGLKIFDLEFFPDQPVKVHYMMEGMNRKSLVKTLTGDISLVLMNRVRQAEPVILGKKDSGDIIYEYRFGNKKYFYYVREAASRPYLARHTAGLTNKVRADLYGNSTTGIDSARIIHENLRLSISLHRLIEIDHADE